MASLSIPLPNKISDREFIRDLMNLFQRHRMTCGDATIFESFAAQLESDTALQSDLFTLCTAISHMAAVDLTGEQLLVLVAQALRGPGFAKGTAAQEIPEPMRKIFLEGYGAWSSRSTFAIQTSWMWPSSYGAEPGAEAANGEPRESADVSRTIPEALEIARERSPNGVLAPAITGTAVNIEHLTISELKKLREDIERRVSRIDPQLTLAGTAETSTAPRGAVLSFESGARAALAADSVDPELEKMIVAENPPATAAVQTASPSIAAVAGSSASDGEVVAPAVRRVRRVRRYRYRSEAPPAITRANAFWLLALAGFVLIALGWGATYVYRAVGVKIGQRVARFTHTNAPRVTRATARGVTQRAALLNASPTRIIVAAVPVASETRPGLHVAVPGSGAASSVESSRRQVATVAAAPAHGTPVAPAAPASPTVQATPDAGQGVAANTTQDIVPVHVPSSLGGSSTTIVGYATKPVHVEQPRGVSGTVMVEVSISKQGSVTDARVLSGPPELKSAAVETVRQWRFKPSIVAGIPTEATTTLGVYFKGQ